MAISDTTQQDNIKSTNNGPGDLLQAGRIEMGLSLEDVAARMHLSTDILAAIEENNFSDITAPIFVKGYLRAYARIVSLDEDKMIQQYVEYYSYEDPPINSTSNVMPEISTSDKRIKLISFLIIFGLGILLAIWWWNKYQNTTDVVSLDVQQATELQQIETIDEIQRVEIEADSEVIVDTSAADTPVEADSLAASESSVESDSAELTDTPETPVEAIASVELEVESEVVVKTAAETVPAADDTVQLQAEIATASQQGSETQAVESSDTITDMIVGSDRLDLVVNADSWIDISDANGRRLAYDLVRANRKFSLTGTAPFTVFFGNGYGVEVTFNDEPIDVISRIKSDNTARLKIGN